MAKPNLIFAAVIFICLTLHGATSFSLNKSNTARTQQPTTTKNILQSPQQPSLNDETVCQPIRTENHLQKSLLAGCITFLTTAPLSAFAAADELEIAELPPVYVPILFAIGIIGGVGVLTASLGNVMDEEASLGLQSGARAKKERDRTRSSYFKK
mmetsp:Transcript_21128/g.38228  ORF Transcript_21128/g.38228 Transcript_21128/m.38228 type:complete len:155 (+) Transcript_21128:189-653(+)|eukprot:CAMPEP_0201880650 /NCGR_PEP_ID=MMETSP0902-20130614/11167_1 /ASSEMBLY_ACC=CAM_ASM_000551 /TAXON_ID=420261 /ORGANISM="Thalassiosira antarctica, Strain CCMP982" /LENGTH=154 /DNA_ID=CAMNT_0048408687 /DNA_START=182 /DNA_END=646 /DNA_ORIENTATION=+